MAVRSLPEPAAQPDPHLVQGTHPRAGGLTWQYAKHVYDTLIVGTGFTGIGTAIKLTQAGVDDFVIVERDDRVGGTWRDNTYPGAACDIPSLLYSFSFVANPTWSRAYSPADEIRTHIEDMVDRFDLRRRIQFGIEVNGLSFDEDAGCLDVRATNGAQARRSAPAPSCWPPVRCPITSGRTSAGIDTYEGHKIHSAHWDHDYDFTGKRVAVIGTGASAVQIVPELVKQAAFVKVFQRTPGWVIPRLDVATPAPAPSTVRESACRTTTCPPGAVLGHEASATALVWKSPLNRARRPARQGPPAQAGQGSVAAPTADAGLHPRLQADAGLQRLLPRAAARQLQAHRLADRDHEPRRHPHQRRRRAPPGRDRVRDRVRRAPDRAAVSGHRARRPIARRRVDARRAGLQEHQRQRLPEPVLHDRTELRAGAQFAAGLRRGPDRLRRVGHHHDPARTTCATSTSVPTFSAATTSSCRSG